MHILINFPSTVPNIFWPLHKPIKLNPRNKSELRWSRVWANATICSTLASPIGHTKSPYRGVSMSTYSYIWSGPVHALIDYAALDARRCYFNCENKKGFVDGRRIGETNDIRERLDGLLMQVHFPMKAAARGVNASLLIRKSTLSLCLSCLLYLLVLRGVIKTESLFCAVLNIWWWLCLGSTGSRALLCCPDLISSNPFTFVIALHSFGKWNMMTLFVSRDANASFTYYWSKNLVFRFALPNYSCYTLIWTVNSSSEVFESPIVLAVSQTLFIPNNAAQCYNKQKNFSGKLEYIYFVTATNNSFVGWKEVGGLNFESPVNLKKCSDCIQRQRLDCS